jgi:hypothetical protein
VWQGDIFATVAAYLGAELPDDVAPDGESFLNLIRGQRKPAPHRDSIVVSSIYTHLGLKTLDGWKFIDSTGGGGNSNSWDSSNNSIPNPAGTNQGVPKQLFHQAVDLGEDDNLISSLTNDAAIRSSLVSQTGRDLLDAIDQYRTTTTTQLYDRIPDNDADDIPNAWEIGHGLDYNDPKNASGDSDGDGFTDGEEYLADTDPNDPADFFRLDSITVDATQVTVGWDSKTGRTYEIFWSNTLAGWTSYSIHSGTGSPATADLDKATLQAAGADLDRLFFRLGVEMP